MPDHSAPHRPPRPVVIAGGGPVGLVLAALLSQMGIASIVIEADEGYCTGSRAICIARRSLEVLAWAGADRHLTTIGLPWVGGRSYFRDAEVLHFRMPSEPGERFPPMINVQQYHVEEAAHRAIVDGLGDVRFGTRVVDVAQDERGARVDVVDHAGLRSTIAADWVVACDGGRSTVRSRLGVALQGVEYEGRYVIVDIEQDTRREVERLAWFDPPSNPARPSSCTVSRATSGASTTSCGTTRTRRSAILPEHVLPRVQSHLAMIGETAPWKPLWISIYNAKCLTLPDYRCGGCCSPATPRTSSRSSACAGSTRVSTTRATSPGSSRWWSGVARVRRCSTATPPNACGRRTRTSLMAGKARSSWRHRTPASG